MNRTQRGGVIFFAMVVFSLALSGQKIKEKDLPEKYRDFLKLTEYIILPQEREVFMSLTEDRDRDIFIETFWKQRDPTAGTPENEFKEEHLKRFNYANKQLGRGTTRKGWMTDMGRLYIILGPPISIERFDTTMDLYPIQVWYYYGDRKKELPAHFAVVFFQRGGSGEYKLYDPVSDGPGSLMVNTKGVSSIDFFQLYEDLKELAPTLADVAISMIPGEIPLNYQPSPMNAIIMADILESPKKSINPAYATHFLNYKGIVSTEYMTNFVESESFVALIKDPVLGLNFLHFSMVPKHLSVDYYEPKDQYYCNFTMNVTLRVKEEIVFQSTKNFPLYFAPRDFERIKATGIAFEDTIPVVKGEYQFIILLQNSVEKEFSIFEKNVMIPEDSERSQVAGPFLGYKTEDYQPGIHIPFKVLNKKLVVDPKNTFSTSEDISFFLIITQVAEGLWREGWVVVSVNPLGPNRTGAKSFSLRLKDYAYAKTMAIFSSLAAGDFSPEYYEIKLTIRSGAGDVLDEKKANFVISPAKTVAHPAAYLKGFPLSDSYVYFYMLAHQYDRMKEYEKAELTFEKAYREKPDYKKGLIEYADFLFKIQKFSKSLGLIEQAKDDPNLKFGYYFIKGKALMGMEKYSEAIDNLLEGNRIYNSDTSLLNSLGFCYYKAGQREKALEVLQASLRLNSDQPEVKKLKAQIER